MDENLEELKHKLSLFQEKLSLVDVEIRIRNSTRTGIHFDENLDSYILNYNDQGIDYGLAHELGHILLSKKTNCPTFANPPLSDDLDDTIFTILDYLINFMVNSLVCRTNDLYKYYPAFFEYYVNLEFTFRNTTELVAFNISTQLEYLFNLKQQDKNVSLLNSMARYNEILKNQLDFNYSKYEEILLKINTYKEVIIKFDLQVILNFLLEITTLICETFNYMDSDNVVDELKKFFPL